jgi:hypothetical protein
LTDLFQNEFGELIALHHHVKDINPALASLYPVAIVQDDRFLVYDFEPNSQSYQFQKAITSPMPIPTGVRAAFPLEAYRNKITCVVTPDIFDNPEGYVTILHEFVHCYQFETCELDLKMSLDIALHAQETGNAMWEIEYPFPYQAEHFIQAYTRFMAAIQGENKTEIQQARRALKAYLGLHDFEYMIWQEWKEGFARCVENKINRYLGRQENTRGSKPPFSRVSFYAGGAAYIDYLSASNSRFTRDLPYLFNYLRTV